MNLYLSVEEFDDLHISRIRELLPEGALSLRTDYSQHAAPEPNFLDCDIVFGNVPAHWFEQSHAVRWAQLDSVGFGEYRGLDWDKIGQQLTLTNLAGFFADPVAQTALAGILALYRGLDKLTLLRSITDWQGDPLRSNLQTLTKKKVVLVGHGAINRRFEELLAPFQCEVMPFARADSLKKLDKVLPDADIVACAVPETDNTVGLFDTNRLALLKASALFINCGRGSVVDERALAECLHSHSIAGAVIDVTIEEPLSAEHPFWSTPNTILSQHSGGGTEDELDKKISVFADNLARFLQGKPLHNCVDFQRGY